MPTSKPILSSKTVWWNLIAGAVQTLPGIAPMIPQPWGALATAIVNILLRYVTTQPVSVR